MKALFLIFHDFSEYKGISKKILDQQDALKQCGFDVKLCYLTRGQDGCHKRMIENDVLENFGQGITAKMKKRYCYAELKNYILHAGIQVLYIRSAHNANPFLIQLLKKLKKAGVRSVLEIPTYPYDHEYRGNLPFSDRLRFHGDRLFRKLLSKQIYRIVTFSNDETIFGVPTINLSNGIDFNHIKMKTGNHKNSACLRLIGVAEIHFWHGFDRVLTGLARYYAKQQAVKVYFSIVGDGVPEELARLRSLVTTNNLHEYVQFEGPRSGIGLDQLFDNADMGIGSLGRHRSHITHIKPLKNREYAARGIPFVYSEIDDDFENMPYVVKAPADESPLDIEKIVEFYNQIEFKPDLIRSSIVNTLSWKIQMEKVAAVLLKGNPTT